MTATRALILNASWEPLSFVSATRALQLLLQSKADTVQLQNVFWRSEKMTHQIPEVIVLRNFVKAKPHKKKIKFSKRAVMLRDYHRCQYCDAPAATVDHVVSKSRGGATSFENCVACCEKCNNAKGSNSLLEIGFTLRIEPRPPTSRISGAVQLPLELMELYGKYRGESRR
uniref:HNH nuclease domain-containing protein n=1 Tax=Octactis speculum TaxID=3111310 RepID=A0A7S2DRD3_9STRA|mmetsp:Transcript_53184/g.72636  ORF Transcript_53184/g.72636 Transcript_53184/m.72636 type:complete len:171 (+) Transcript_53184:51-563(+)